MRWVKKLNIKYFRAVYSRDNLPKIIKKRECGIINLNKENLNLDLIGFVIEILMKNIASISIHLD